MCRPRKVFGGAGRRDATHVRGSRRVAAGPVLGQEDDRGTGARGIRVVFAGGAATVQDRPQGPVRGRRGRADLGPRGRVQGTATGVRSAARAAEQGEEEKTDAAQEKLTET